MRSAIRSIALVAMLALIAIPVARGAAPRLSGSIQFMTWSSGPNYEPALKKMAALFMKEHPGTSVQVIVLPYTTWQTKFPLLAATHSEPDVFQMDTALWTLFNQGIAADLRPYIKTDPFLNDPKTFITHAWAATPSLHGKVLAVPTGLDDMVLYYNRDLFARAHVAPPDDRWTWTDFLKAAQRLTLDNQGHNALDPHFDRTNIVQFGVDPSSLQVYWGYWAPIWENGGDLFNHNVNPTKCTLNTPASVKGLQFVADLVTRYHVAPSPSQSKALGGATPFATGKVALSYDGDWSFATYATIKSFRWDAALPPLGPLGRKNTFWSGAYSLGRDSKNPQLAWAFLRFLAEDKTAQTAFSNLGVGIPVRQDVARSAAFLHPSWAPPHYINRLRALDGARFGEPLFPGWSEVNNRYWTPAQDKLWRGEVTAAQAAKQICSATDTFLKTVKY